jgi:hypothetical protein
MAFTSDAFASADADLVAKAYQKEFGLEATVLHTRAGNGGCLL